MIIFLKISHLIDPNISRYPEFKTKKEKIVNISEIVLSLSKAASIQPTYHILTVLDNLTMLLILLYCPMISQKLQKFTILVFSQETGFYLFSLFHKKQFPIPQREQKRIHRFHCLMGQQKIATNFIYKF